LEAKRVNRVAGWLLAVPVGFLWLLAITFAFLSLAALSQIGVKEPMDLFGFGAFALVIGLICFLAILLTGLLHDALAVYEFTLQDVSKRSPFREQRANWSEVARAMAFGGCWTRKGECCLVLNGTPFPKNKCLPQKRSSLTICVATF
jgi:fatty acid desaturase